MAKKVWYFNSKPNPKMDELTKKRIDERCGRFIESVLKPKFISSSNESSELDVPNTIVVDIYFKWWRNFIHFYAKYRDTRPELEAIGTSDLKLARIEYLEEDKYNLAYFRHTGKWWKIFFGISLEECFEAIEDMPHFHPY